ncbi:hypothetical protein HAX54_037313 [Datura stramonium]|uniref:Uncharacterized protein n=1 Tax=Datura stramonium TaxID=4076 RepID=A0ABS8RGX1_DATST|nr:hypothetical protein [Datura stramonium]
MAWRLPRNRDQYSCHRICTVEADAGRALFYYFTESTQDPSTNPLVLWLNGEHLVALHSGLEQSWNLDHSVSMKMEKPCGSTLLPGIMVLIPLSSAKSVITIECNQKPIILLETKRPDKTVSPFLSIGWKDSQNINTVMSVLLERVKLTGNGIIDDETMNSGTYDFYWTHALISDEVHQGIFFIATSRQRQPKKLISGFDPCSADYVDNYQNSAEVQKALNVKDIPRSWDSRHTALPVFQELMQSGIRVWIYSRDIDHMLSVTTSSYVIDKIKTPVKTPWYPWFFQGKVGGYAVEYKNLTFVTVRGAGHFVPSYQPGHALTMFSSFIKGTLPPHLH